MKKLAVEIELSHALVESVDDRGEFCFDFRSCLSDHGLPNVVIATSDCPALDADDYIIVGRIVCDLQGCTAIPA